MSAKGEGAASGSQPSLDEFDDEVDQPALQSMEEEEPSFEDMLQKKIDEISSTKKTGESLIQAGMFAFERGAYPNAVQLFEESLEYIGPMTEKGGEAQIWLAMSYEACQRLDECVALYTKLETGHASMLIRKQAGEPKYIAEAPRLKINKDERVEIPDLSDLERPGASKNFVVRKPRKKIELTLEEKALQNWAPKLPNKYILVATWLVSTGLAIYSARLAGF